MMPSRFKWNHDSLQNFGEAFKCPELDQNLDSLLNFDYELTTKGNYDITKDLTDCLMKAAAHD